MQSDRFHSALRAAIICAALSLAAADGTPNGWLCALLVAGSATWSRRRVERQGRSWSAAAVTALVLAATAGAVGEYYFLRVPLILALGHYMLAVQAARLMERKKNRDHAQLLLLSALVMVISSVVSSSVSYAVFLLLYLYHAVGAVLLLQLKRESDRRRDALAWCDLDADYIRRTDLYARTPALPVRRFALRTALCLLAVGATVSFLMPRGMGGFLGDWQARPASRTGFDDTVDFTRPGKVEQDDTVVMHVRFTDPVTGERAAVPDERLLLRGATQEMFDGMVWSTPWPGSNVRRVHGTEQTKSELGRLGRIAGRRVVRQEVTLYNAQGAHLFTLYPPAHLDTPPGAETGLDRFDLTLRCRENLRGTQHYVVDSVRPEAMTPPLRAEIDQIVRDSRSPNGNVMNLKPGEYAARFSKVSPHIVRIRPTRTRRGERGASATLRNEDAEEQLNALARSVLAEAAARTGRSAAVLTPRERVTAIESWLRTQFRYSLDAPEQLALGGQPVMDFLFLYRRGNCQFFAASMVMLCRTEAVDVPARLVTGFRGGEYNDAGGFHIVRARDAHAWVEVYFAGKEPPTGRDGKPLRPQLPEEVGDGWVTFDPTPTAEAVTDDGFWLFRKMRELYNYLDFQWGETVLSYNRPQRDNATGSAMNWIAGWIGKALPMDISTGEGLPWGSFLRPDHLDQIALVVIGGVLLFGGLWWLLRRSKAPPAGGAPRGRRPARAPVEPPATPSVPQYDSLIALLADLGVVKLPQATPMAFARMLAAAAPTFSALPTVMGRLYFARYSGRPLSDEHRVQVEDAHERLRRLRRPAGE